jgi:hypothetical protein
VTTTIRQAEAELKAKAREERVSVPTRNENARRGITAQGGQKIELEQMTPTTIAREAVDVERLVAALEALETRVRVLEGRERARDELHAAAIVALAAAVQYRTFTAKSAIAHARHADRDLLEALRVAGVDTPRTLGRWLRTVQRTPIAGLRVECQGKNGDGALWVFRSA